MRHVDTVRQTHIRDRMSHHAHAHESAPTPDKTQEEKRTKRTKREEVRGGEVSWSKRNKKTKTGGHQANRRRNTTGHQTNTGRGPETATWYNPKTSTKRSRLPLAQQARPAGGQLASWGSSGYLLIGRGGGDPPKRGGPKSRRGFILFGIYTPIHVFPCTYILLALICIYIYRLAMGEEYDL